MIYTNMAQGEFISRPNRFIAQVDLAGERMDVHVKNTGRCAELLTQGARVWLQRSGNPKRKTGYDLIAVEKDGQVVNIDSAAPNAAFGEWAAQSGLFGCKPILYPERRFGASRFDFYIEQGGVGSFVEVKGVTLMREGVALFPDAPTERGVRHLHELIAAAAQGYGAYLFFIIQLRGARYLSPNWETHPAFGEAMRKAREGGVHLQARECTVTPESMAIGREVEIRL